MATESPQISLFGIAVGGTALLIALVHFWAGPFAPQPSLERTVAETAVAIRDATVAAMRGEEIEEASPRRDFDLDKGLRVLAPVLGGIAVILGVTAVAKGEPLRAAAGSAILGGAAIAFQFAIVALGVIVLAILVGGVLAQLDF